MQISLQTRKAFEKIDTNKNGVSFEELKKFDIDGNGELSKEEAEKAGIDINDLPVINKALKESSLHDPSEIACPYIKIFPSEIETVPIPQTHTLLPPTVVPYFNEMKMAVETKDVNTLKELLKNKDMVDIIAGYKPELVDKAQILVLEKDRKIEQLQIDEPLVKLPIGKGCSIVGNVGFGAEAGTECKVGGDVSIRTTLKGTVGFEGITPEAKVQVKLPKILTFDLSVSKGPEVGPGVGASIKFPF